MKNNQKDQNKDNFDSILAKESPNLFLKLNKEKTELRLPGSAISQPAKLILIIVLIDLAVGLISSIIAKTSHFLILGNQLWLSLPWWIACLDGFIFIGYGIYVITKKKGQLDISSSSSSFIVNKEISGDASSLLGFLYIILGIFLLIAVLIQMLI